MNSRTRTSGIEIPIRQILSSELEKETKVKVIQNADRAYPAKDTGEEVDH